MEHHTIEVMGEDMPDEVPEEEYFEEEVVLSPKKNRKRG